MSPPRGKPSIYHPSRPQELLEFFEQTVDPTLRKYADWAGMEPSTLSKWRDRYPLFGKAIADAIHAREMRRLELRTIPRYRCAWDTDDELNYLQHISNHWDGRQLLIGYMKGWKKREILEGMDRDIIAGKMMELAEEMGLSI